MSLTSFLRILLWLAIALALYLALTPGPIGQAIESGKIRHAIAFMVLPWITMMAYPSLRLRWIVVLYAIFGGVIELVQGAMQAGRHAEWADWFFDLLFIMAAIVIGLIVRPLFIHQSKAGRDR
ncbi:hypothetical protein D6851_16080 [Altericroceibacterium spongiae]|uniref:VanZ family protein n=1 Tax=Altericroceibacterium spongiae TaxID=2320269 RepID=A0A420EAG6_9SPHN|nr:hypothetical protein [Altericroceibacterium spongiae]RKF17650.1 hypothetical protein D6851_16080 [Altericroceibacterium spongiae]